MKKFKSYFFIFLHLLVLLVVVLNLYNTIIKNRYSVFSSSVILAVLALDGFVSGIRYIYSNKSKLIGIILVSLPSATIYASASVIFFRLRYSI